MLRMRTMPANMSICNSRAERWYNLHQIFTQLQFGLYVMIKLQILSSTKYFQLGICKGWTFNEYPAFGNTFSLSAMPSNNFRFITVRQKLLCFKGKTRIKANIGLMLFVHLLYLLSSLVFQFIICNRWSLV